jgi:hypothetical protein
MKKTSKIAAAAALGLGLVMMGADAVSAAVVCNGEGACWHVRHAYAYHPEFGIVVHPDNWRWGAGEHYAWREHAGRGYWRHGAWVRF